MAELTSAEAAKILRKLNDELAAVSAKEEQSREFVAALGEDVESVRPDYSYSETRGRIDELEGKIRLLKHAINVFNTTTLVPEIDMTIDQALIYIPQLTGKCARLRSMMSKLPKVRETVRGMGHNNPVIDYRYINYDPAEAERDYRECKRELDRAQIQLDLVNSTLRLSVPDEATEI